MRENYYRTGEGFFCVFSLTERHSLDAVRRFHDQICRAVDRDDPPCILVGNKTDLEAQRMVAFEEGTKLAATWGNTVYMEMSAKEGTSVEDAFQTLVRMVAKDKAEASAKNPLEEPSVSCCIIC